MRSILPVTSQNTAGSNQERPSDQACEKEGAPERSSSFGVPRDEGSNEGEKRAEQTGDTPDCRGAQPQSGFQQQGQTAQEQKQYADRRAPSLSVVPACGGNVKTDSDR